MRELGLVVVCAVKVDTRYLGDVDNDSDPKLDRPKLENKEMHLLVPRLPVSWWLLGSPRGDLQITEVRLTLVAVWADEFQHQKKKVSQRQCLHDVGPWVYIEVRLGNEDADQHDGGGHG